MIARRAAALLIAVAGPVFGTSVHEFCVTRVKSAGDEQIHTRFHVGAEDPGREAASLLLVRHFRQPGVLNVAIDAYDPAHCTAAEAQDIVLTRRVEQTIDRQPAQAIPNLGRVANVASGAMTGIAEEASRLMCRFLPC